MTIFYFRFDLNFIFTHLKNNLAVFKEIKDLYKKTYNSWQ